MRFSPPWGKFQVALRLPSFGSAWVFSWGELCSLLSTTRQSQLSSKSLDGEFLSKIREYIVSRSDDDDDDDGSIGAVTVFLYLLLAMSESPPAAACHTR